MPFRYRLYTTMGDDIGEASYADVINPGEMIHVGAGAPYLVISVLTFEADESAFHGILQVSEPIEVE